MGWRGAVASVLLGGTIVGEAWAVWFGTVAPAAAAEAAGMSAAGPPPAPSGDVILPPHLRSAPHGPQGWTPPPGSLPTLQDLMVISPTYPASPPGKKKNK